MGKTETTHRKADQKLADLQKRRDELWTKGEVVKSDLAAFRTESSSRLVRGGDGERLAGELAKREAKAGLPGYTCPPGAHKVLVEV